MPVRPLTSQSHPIEINQPSALFHHNTTPNLELLAARGDQQEFLGQTHRYSDPSNTGGWSQQADHYGRRRQSLESRPTGREVGGQSIQMVQRLLVASFPGDDQLPGGVCIQEEEIISSSAFQAGQETKKLDIPVPTQERQEKVQKAPSLTSDEGNRITETQGARRKDKKVKQKLKARKHTLQFGDDPSDVMCPFGHLPVRACRWLGSRIARRAHVLRYHYKDVQHCDFMALAINTARVLFAHNEMFLCYTFIHPTANILYCVVQHASASKTCKERFYYTCEIFTSEGTFLSEKEEVISMDETTFGTLVASGNILALEGEIVSKFVAEKADVLFLIIPSFLGPVLTTECD
jgi:hypothetical protein